ncbi:hypothetical protein ACHAPJ_011558 [Fusarium lateritium]
MGEREDPLCALCGTFIGKGGSLDWGPNIWDRGSWVHNAFAIEGPEYLGEPVESSGHPDELFTWHPATGYTHGEGGWGHLTLLPSRNTVYPHTTWSNRDLTFVKSGHLYHGFHRACASIARQFIQRTTGYPVKSFSDIWITLNARYSKGGPHKYGSDRAPYGPTKTERGTYVWDSEAAYYLGYSDRIEWWRYDPFHIPNLTSRLLENLQPMGYYSTKDSKFHNMMGNLPKELVDEVISHLLSGIMSPYTTDLMPQRFWKQVFVQIPFLWDLDVEQVQRFPDVYNDPHGEWNWEGLVRQVLCGPPGRRVEECERVSHNLWDYSHDGLDAPPGLTNRRRIWQVLEDMDPKELDVLDEPDFIVLDDNLDRFIARTVKDGVNVEDPDSTYLDWDSPSLSAGTPADGDWATPARETPDLAW